MPRSVLHTAPSQPSLSVSCAHTLTKHNITRPTTHALLSKHIWPFRFNGLKPLGYLSTYTGARLKRGHNNSTHTPNLKLRHSHDTKPCLRYYS